MADAASSNLVTNAIVRSAASAAAGSFVSNTPVELRERLNEPRAASDERNPGDGLHSRCFPLSLRYCCPCLPSSLKNIQDWLHLVLVLGILSTFVCVVMQIVEITSSGSCHSPLCVRQWIAALVLVPSVWDFIKFVGAYDESLQHHQERAEEEVNTLIQQINAQVSEMQVVCGKLTESATDFAGRAFTQSRERFEKFILDIQRFYKELYQDDLLVQQLREFIYKWFTTYCQSLLDQDQNCSVVGLKEELDKCLTVEDVCAAATKRLAMLKINSVVGLVPSHSIQVPSQSSQARELPTIGGDVEDGASIISNGSTASVATTTRKCGVQWLRFGRTTCGRLGPRTGDGARVVSTDWPMRVGFLCGNLTILSRRHLNHLMYLVVDLLLIGWELINLQTYSGLLVIANFACVISTLACFEQIDEIAKLQQRIAKYQTKSEKVKEDFKQATDNWEKVQQLHDLWNYRTMPFLAIMGKIHHALDDMDREISHEGPRNDKRLEWLEHANQCLEALDQKLGLANDWTRPGNDEWKATIGRQLKNAERSENVDRLIESLPLLTSSNLAALDDTGTSSGLLAASQMPAGRSSARMPSPTRSPAASPPPSRR